MKLLSLVEAAKEMKISTRTLLRWEKSGHFLPDKQVGRYRFYNPYFVQHCAKSIEIRKLINKNLCDSYELKKAIKDFNPDELDNYVIRIKHMNMDYIKKHKKDNIKLRNLIKERDEIAKRYNATLKI